MIYIDTSLWDKVVSSQLPNTTAIPTGGPIPGPAPSNATSVWLVENLSMAKLGFKVNYDKFVVATRLCCKALLFIATAWQEQITVWRVIGPGRTKRERKSERERNRRTFE